MLLVFVSYFNQFKEGVCSVKLYTVHFQLYFSPPPPFNLLSVIYDCGSSVNAAATDKN